MKKVFFVIAALAALVSISSCEKKAPEDSFPYWDEVKYKIRDVSSTMCTLDINMYTGEVGENKITIIAIAKNEPDVSKWTNLNSTGAAEIEEIWNNLECSYSTNLACLMPETKYYIYITLVAPDQTILKVSHPSVITTTAPSDDPEGM